MRVAWAFSVLLLLVSGSDPMTPVWVAPGEAPDADEASLGKASGTSDPAIPAAQCDGQTCDDYPDPDECLAVLDNIFDSMGNQMRLTVQKSFIGADKLCASLDDRSCLVILDEYRQELMPSARRSVLLTACDQAPQSSDTGMNSGPVSSADAPTDAPTDSDGSDEDGCTPCSGLTDKDCLSALDAMVVGMSDIDRLAFEKNYAAGQCEGLEDKECLQKLDRARMMSSDRDRLAMLTQACVATASPETESSDGSEPEATTEDPTDSSDSETHDVSVTWPSAGTRSSSGTTAAPWVDPQEEPKSSRVSEGNGGEAHGGLPPIGDSERDDNLGDGCTDDNTQLQHPCGSQNGAETSDTSSQENGSDDCAPCSGLTDKDCLSALDAMVVDMDDVDRLAFEKVFAGGQCEGLDDQACLRTLDQTRVSSPDKDRLAMLKQACVAKSGTASNADAEAAPEATPSASDESNDEECVPCSGLSDKECLASLDAMVIGMKDIDRLAFEKVFAGGQCEGLDDQTCLETLDKARVSSSDKDRLVMLKEACVATAGDPSAAGDNATPDEAADNPDSDECNPCSGLTDKDCLDALDAMVVGMNDIDRLAFEKNYAAGQCEGLEDQECLQTLDQARIMSSDKDRLTMLTQACIATSAGPSGQATPSLADPTPESSDSSDNSGGKPLQKAPWVPPDAPPKDGTSTTEASAGDMGAQPADASPGTDESEECEPCDGLSDEECLSALDAMVASMNDIDRLAFEKNFAAGQCADLNDDACLEILDKARMTSSDKDRLSMLKESCVATASHEHGSVDPVPEDATGDDTRDGKPLNKAPWVPPDAPPEETKETDDSAGDGEPEPVEASPDTGDDGGDGVVSPDAITRINEADDDDSEKCAPCVGLSDKDCLNALDAMVIGMDDEDRLAFEKVFAGGQCEGLDDRECLETLDKARVTSLDKDRLTMLKEACAEKSGTVGSTDGELAAPQDPPVSTQNTQASDAGTDADVGTSGECAPCSGLTDKDCLSALDAMVVSMDDIDRLAFEKNYAAGQCEDLDGPACLEKLDQARVMSSDQDRLTMLKEACVAQADTSDSDANTSKAAPEDAPTSSESAGSKGNDIKSDGNMGDGCTDDNTQLRHPCTSQNGAEASDTSSQENGSDDCAPCIGLTDKDCLSALDAMVVDMDDVDRLAFEKNYAAGQCEDLDGPACLQILDQARVMSSDKDRLAMLKQACVASTTQGDQDQQPIKGSDGSATPALEFSAQDLSMTHVGTKGRATLATMGAVSTLVVGIVVSTRRRHRYQPIEEDNWAEIA